MRKFRFLSSLAGAALFLLPLSAKANVLNVVNVGAPAINCVFNVTCTVVVTDSVGNFVPPGDAGNARLQSRTYLGAAPAPLAGKMAYVYRVDLTAATTPLAVNCVTALQVTFGPVVPGPYTPGGLKDVYVVTSGGLGSIGIASATYAAGAVTFNFAGGGVCPGATSFFFGLASATTAPVPGTATLFYSAGGSATTADRVP
jgi:hypothetical protein